MNRPTRRGSRGEVVSTLLPSGLSAAIDGFASRHGFTLYGLAVSALALLLHRVTGEAKIVVGSQVAHREEPTAETLAGPTVNSITLCLPVDDHATLLTFARMTADEVQEALHHQGLPFEVAVPAGTCRAAARRQSRRPSLVLQHAECRACATASSACCPCRPSPSGAQWDLNFFLVWRDEGWRMSCEADTDRYDEATVKQLLDGWRICLEALVTSPDQRLADCPAIAGISTRAKTRPVEAPSSQASGPGGHREPIALHDPAQQVVRFHENGSRTPMIAMNNRSVYYQLARRWARTVPSSTSRPIIPTARSTSRATASRTSRPTPFVSSAGRSPTAPIFSAAIASMARSPSRRHGSSSAWARRSSSSACSTPGRRVIAKPCRARTRSAAQRQLRTRYRLNRIEQYRKGEIGLKDLVWRPIARRLGLPMAEEAGPTEANLFAGRWFDDHIREAAAHHRPAPANIDAVIFRSAETLRGALFDERMGWGPIVAGKLYQASIDSAHLDMFQEKPAAAIASFLGPLLAGIEGRRNG